jgi:glucan-binding YG repeat protein
MGCTGSKNKEKKPENAKAADTSATGATAQQQQNNAVSAQQAAHTPSNKSVETPAGRANPQDGANAKTDVSSTAAPGKVPRSGNSDAGGSTGAARNAEVDEDGNPVVLPKGDWVKTEGTPYYYSATENLYYHPPSCQFYDPTNEMWYDPEKDEWYHDDASDEEAAA